MVLGAGLALQSQPFGATAAGARLVDQLAASSVGAVGGVRVTLLCPIGPYYTPRPPIRPIAQD